MKLSDLDYDLPAHLIAQHPAAERDGARLLTVSRGAAVVGHHVFRDLPELLRPGDLLVLNDTRVLPARLVGKRARTDGRWEGLFVRATAEGAWELLCQTRGRPTMGEIILVDGEQTSDQLRLRLIGRRGTHWLAEPQSQETAADLLARFGRVPLPPYIRKGKAEPVDRERYQTLYADRLGAVAAPTAGLHFTRQLLETLAQRGIGQAFVTLHIGPGTFQPVQTDDPRQHQVSPEWGELPSATAVALAHCREKGGRIVAVGTTSVRLLETAARRTGFGKVWSGLADLTICPPFEFLTVDALITNFHLPRSSLLMLVAAFTGLDSMRAAYQTAIQESYRFYSYGDAMLST